jgi:hypothetical protein
LLSCQTLAEDKCTKTTDFLLAIPVELSFREREQHLYLSSLGSLVQNQTIKVKTLENSKLILRKEDRFFVVVEIDSIFTPLTDNPAN